MRSVEKLLAAFALMYPDKQDFDLMLYDWVAKYGHPRPSNVEPWLVEHGFTVLEKQKPAPMPVQARLFS